MNQQFILHDEHKVELNCKRKQQDEGDVTLLANKKRGKGASW